jgi:hypothetical protein
MRTDFARRLRSSAERLGTEVALRERVTEIRRQLLARIDVTGETGASGFDGDRIAPLIAQFCRGVTRQSAIVASFNDRLSFAVASCLRGAGLHACRGGCPCMGCPLHDRKARVVDWPGSQVHQVEWHAGRRLGRPRSASVAVASGNRLTHIRRMILAGLRAATISE